MPSPPLAGVHRHLVPVRLSLMHMAPDRPLEAFLAAPSPPRIPFRSQSQLQGARCRLPAPPPRRRRQLPPQAPQEVLQAAQAAAWRQTLPAAPLGSQQWRHPAPAAGAPALHCVRRLRPQPALAGGRLHLLEQFVVLRKRIDGKRADFDGFLSNLGFAKVGAPPPSTVPEPAPVSQDQEEDGAGIRDSDDEDGAGVGVGDSEAVDNASGTQQPAQRLPARLLNIPLSNVERLRSTLSAVSLTELIELVPHLVSRSSASADAHPDKKKLFSVQDFFRYAEIEDISIDPCNNRAVLSCYFVVGIGFHLIAAEPCSPQLAS